LKNLSSPGAVLAEARPGCPEGFTYASDISAESMQRVEDLDAPTQPSNRESLKPARPHIIKCSASYPDRCTLELLEVREHDDNRVRMTCNDGETGSDQNLDDGRPSESLAMSAASNASDMDERLSECFERPRGQQDRVAVATPTSEDSSLPGARNAATIADDGHLRKAAGTRICAERGDSFENGEESSEEEETEPRSSTRKQSRCFVRQYEPSGFRQLSGKSIPFSSKLSSIIFRSRLEELDYVTSGGTAKQISTSRDTDRIADVSTMSEPVGSG